MCRLLGVGPQDVVGRALGSFSVGHPVPASDLQPFLSGQERTYASIRAYRGAGKDLRAMVTLGAIRGLDGAAHTIFGELEDLTAQELARTELDRQRHRLELAIEASNMAVWELDVISGRVTIQDRVAGASAFRGRA